MEMGTAARELQHAIHSKCKKMDFGSHNLWSTQPFEHRLLTRKHPQGFPCTSQLRDEPKGKAAHHSRCQEMGFSQWDMHICCITRDIKFVRMVLMSDLPTSISSLPTMV